MPPLVDTKSVSCVAPKGDVMLVGPGGSAELACTISLGKLQDISLVSRNACNTGSMTARLF